MDISGSICCGLGAGDHQVLFAVQVEINGIDGAVYHPKIYLFAGQGECSQWFIDVDPGYEPFEDIPAGHNQVQISVTVQVCEAVGTALQTDKILIGIFN